MSVIATPHGWLMVCTIWSANEEGSSAKYSMSLMSRCDAGSCPAAAASNLDM